METRYGVRGTVLDGIFFTEAEITNANIVKHLHVEISRQNSNLMEVKKELARQTKNLGSVAIMNFKYGQKKHSTLALLALKWDTESWHGEGDAIIF